MLSTLILENFKAFGERQVIPLAPITLIFGANSSGKSSILQSLLLLKQTLCAPAGRESVLATMGDLTDLGSFPDLVFRGDTDRVCEIAPLLRPRDPLADVVAFHPYTPPPEPAGGLGPGFQYRWVGSKSLTELATIPYYWGATREPAYSWSQCDGPDAGDWFSGNLHRHHSNWIDLNPFDEDQRFFSLDEFIRPSQLWAQLYNQFLKHFKQDYTRYLRQQISHTIDAHDNRDHWLNRLLKKIENYTIELFLQDVYEFNSEGQVAIKNFLPSAAIKTYSFYPELPTPRDDWFAPNRSTFSPIPDLVQLSLKLASELSSTLEKLMYLGPLREPPKRYHHHNRNMWHQVGKSGEFMSNVLFNRHDIVRETNDALRDLGLGYSLDVTRLTAPDAQGHFALRLVDRQLGTMVSLSDVGFGVSQVLPVVVQSLLSKETVILVEQPELHLHPRLQAELGSLFARGIKAPQQNQFIIETHSEHLILRLQRLIRKEELKATDVSVIYVLKDENGSRCLPLRLDEEGHFIDAWPGGFFEEGFYERFS
jgi:hypothetical protein